MCGVCSSMKYLRSRFCKPSLLLLPLSLLFLAAQSFFPSFLDSLAIFLEQTQELTALSAAGTTLTSHDGGDGCSFIQGFILEVCIFQLVQTRLIMFARLVEPARPVDSFANQAVGCFQAVPVFRM